MLNSPDFIVVGAGSAGCIVARVVAEAGFRVLLIEAGNDLPVDRTPARYPHLFGSSADWDFATVPQSHLANRRIRWPRGRGPGGSTRINAMIWYPPSESDLARLAKVGGQAWSSELLCVSLDQVASWVRPEHARWISPVTKRFLSAVQGLDLDVHVFKRMALGGLRRTAADVMHDSSAIDSIQRLTATVQRVICENECASGVEVLHQESGIEQRELIRANIAVVLCGGTIASPSILMRSGIGPVEVLDELGVQPIHVVDQVGKNLADHLIMPVVFGTREVDRFPTIATCHDLARLQIAATGPLLSNLAEAGGIVDVPHTEQFRKAAGHERHSNNPTPAARNNDRKIQFHVTPTHYLLHPSPRAPAAMTIGINVCQPQSRGTIRLRRSVAAGSPMLEIDPQYLSHPRDLDLLIDAVQSAREIARQAPLATILENELVPGAKRDTRATIANAIARYAQTLYHPTGTCRMGVDAASVVDEQLAVRGIRNLYVIDASILPTIPSVNPNACVMMAAMHAAKSLVAIAS